MNVHAAIDIKSSGLTRPNGDPIRLNTQSFVAIDRHKDTTYEATYRPQALYSRANEGFTPTASSRKAATKHGPALWRFVLRVLKCSPLDISESTDADTCTR